ncbi:MAG TPA: hypothetical protein VMI53_04030 [Opitutaceae bacterium]|nr:hypothetical protein [Opitutaceae bacterium]
MKNLTWFIALVIGGIIGIKIIFSPFPSSSFPQDLRGELNLNLRHQYDSQNPPLHYEIVTSAGQTFLLDKQSGEVWRYYAEFGDKNHPTNPTSEGFTPLTVYASNVTK